MSVEKVYHEYKELMKTCTKCQETKPREDFLWAQRAGKPLHFRYRRAWCISCMREKYKKDNKKKVHKNAKRKYRATQNGVFRSLSDSMNASAKKRRKTNRDYQTRDEITIGYDDLIRKWEEQDQKCAYSSIVMTYEKGHYNTVSVERLNDDKGYTDENTVLICWAFQTYHGKWSQGKWQQFYNHKPDQGLNDISIMKNVKQANQPSVSTKTQSQTRRFFKTFDGQISYLECTNCHEMLPLDSFWNNKTDKYKKHSQCKSCSFIHKTNYKNTLKGYLKNFLNMTKVHCRQISRTNGREFINDLTFEDLLEMYAEQKERCAYSDMPICFYRTDNWQASLERKDPMVGYTRSNCVFVAQEFNGPCQLSRQLVQSWKCQD